MSERGSFVTEFIYCPSCFAAACTVLAAETPHITGMIVAEGHIIAGRIREMYQGGELVYAGHELLPRLAPLLCHPLRVAVLAESGQDIFVLRDGSVQSSHDAVWSSSSSSGS